MTPKLTSEQVTTVSRISGLVIANAMIFHEILAENDARLSPISKVLTQPNVISAFEQQWTFILDKINYFAIFHVARDMLRNLGSAADVTAGIKALAGTAQEIITMRAALRHDLMGRIYHRLLVEAKYLGTYYTSIPSAALLLKLALRNNGWRVDWGDLKQVGDFRIADLACGTGTLLVASAESVMDNYVEACSRAGKPVDLNGLHIALAEKVLYGYDVLAAAIHLTASTLALRTPQVTFKKMNLYSLPLGGPYHKLGSLEFLKGKFTTLEMDLFGALPAPQQVTGTELQDVSHLMATLGELDLCVMNPPFVRSVGGNLLFGSLPDAERKVMQADLKKLVQKNNVPASITAGLGSVFVALANYYIKTGGRIALVLPKALLSGVSWKPTRQLLGKGYRVEYIIASQDPDRWNFSESTDLSEVLLVAQKVGSEADGHQGNVVALNLWRNPPTAFEALAMAHSLLNGDAPDVSDGQGSLDISIGTQKVGEAVSLPWAKLRAKSEWILPCAFAQNDLIRVAYHLIDGKVWVPGHKTKRKVALCKFGDLGIFGPDRRDIHDGFKLSSAATPYPAFWGHDAGALLTLNQDPNQYLAALSKAKKGRHLRDAADLWPLAGRVLVAERLWLKTTRLVAARLSEPVLSNVWWPFALHKASAQKEKALILWLNSTLGLIMLLAHREETRGAWVDFKKPVLGQLPVIDLSALSTQQLKQLAASYDGIVNHALQPLPQMANDEVRVRIDQAVSDALGLPDCTTLREMLAREPVVCLQRL